MSDWRNFFLNADVANYRIIDYIATGGFGLVFRARDRNDGVEVALKLLPPTTEREAIDEFDHEGDLLEILKSSSGVTNLIESASVEYPISLSDGSALPLPVRFHALELAYTCLEQLVLNRQTLIWRDRLSLWRGVVLGVHQMHLKKVAHRDLKSGNCLVFLHRKNQVDCKVSDLGRSRNWAQPRSHPIEMYARGLGDFRFAPPEFLYGEGRDSERCHKLADLYGLGSILFELATGQGITSLALGSGRTVMNNVALKRARGYNVELSALVDDYDRAYQVFSESVPPSLRDKATTLIRQLCNPVPELRLPRTSGRKPVRIDPGLQWLLNRADIMERSLVEPKSTRSISAVVS